MKVVEKPGPPIMAGIAANNPFKDRPCWKEHCPLEQAGLKCKGKCMLEGFVYKATCQWCQKSDRIECKSSGVYVGETSRQVGKRALEHLENFNNWKKESFILEH